MVNSAVQFFCNFLFNLTDLLLSGIIPPAVITRGGKAKTAYRRAVENGKTCDKIMLNQAFLKVFIGSIYLFISIYFIFHLL